jgi:hypothetical protein
MIVTAALGHVPPPLLEQLKVGETVSCCDACHWGLPGLNADNTSVPLEKDSGLLIINIWSGSGD